MTVVDGPKELRHDAVIREAAHSLAETLAGYRTLTRKDLEERSNAGHWRSVGFDQALNCAVSLGLIRQLGDDLYEVPREGPTA